MMSRASKRDLLLAVGPRYRLAQRALKEQILTEFIAATGYHRKYAITLLNHPPAPRLQHPRSRPRRYGLLVHQALITLWHAANRICAKRLVPFLPELIS